MKVRSYYCTKCKVVVDYELDEKENKCCLEMAECYKACAGVSCPKCNSYEDLIVMADEERRMIKDVNDFCKISDVDFSNLN